MSEASDKGAGAGVDAEILFEVRGTLGLVTLNRPKALNALTASMCADLYKQLAVWAGDDRVRVVAVVGAGDKAFCAGGDVVKVARSTQAGTDDGQAFFHTEYHMNVAISDFPKPYVSFVDGITMGGGVGISIPGDFWVATEKTLFAMPETGLGLFPDVGGGWFLPRLKGGAGMYLALTGARLKAADLLHLGIATHAAASAQVPALLQALEGASDAQDVARILEAGQSAGMIDRADPAPITQVSALVDAAFTAPTLAGVFERLRADGSDWAQKQLSILASKSPLSLALTFRQLQEGAKHTSFADNMAMEYRMVNRMAKSHDFLEGVRAILVDKDQAPVWQPATLDAVSDAEVDAFFAPLGEGAELMDRLPS